MQESYDFAGYLAQKGLSLPPLPLSTLQVNITKLCNQACVHCHVDASPRRREMMPPEVLAAVTSILSRHPEIATLDITGGAPELHPDFRSLVRSARRLGKTVIVRHNLTVAEDPHPLDGSNLSDLPDFFAEEAVEVVSSLPYHQEFFTDKQRGSGVFKKSIRTLKRLNELGYGAADGRLKLNLVYNPVGAFLPAPQATLERDYKDELEARYGIRFNHLFTITNMPIHRFKAQLKRAGGYEAYMRRLVDGFNAAAAAGVMCRTLLSVSHDGKLYDCDFNQMLGMEAGDGGEPLTVFNFDRARLAQRSLKFGAHCFGCTAGSGSSCGGTTANG